MYCAYCGQRQQPEPAFCCNCGRRYNAANDGMQYFRASAEFIKDTDMAALLGLMGVIFLVIQPIFKSMSGFFATI